MPRLIKKKAKAPHTPSKSLRRKKAALFSYSLRGFLKTCGFVGLGLLVTWMCFSKTPGIVMNRGLGKFYAFTQSHGLKVKTIHVEGQYYTLKSDILRESHLKVGDPILKLSPSSIQTRVEALPWLRSVKVQRILPSTLRIKVAEKLPIALYQKNKKLTLVDDQGKLIQGARVGKFSYLPIIIGEGSAERAPELFAALTTQPYLQKQLSSAILVSKRRWDLILNSKVTVHLPEEGVGKSLRHLSKLTKDESVKMADVRSIDLRIPDRLYIELKDKAMAARKTARNRRRV